MDARGRRASTAGAQPRETAGVGGRRAGTAASPAPSVRRPAGPGESWGGSPPTIAFRPTAAPSTNGAKPRILAPPVASPEATRAGARARSDPPDAVAAAAPARAGPSPAAVDADAAGAADGATTTDAVDPILPVESNRSVSTLGATERTPHPATRAPDAPETARAEPPPVGPPSPDAPSGPEPRTTPPRLAPSSTASILASVMGTPPPEAKPRRGAASTTPTASQRHAPLAPSYAAPTASSQRHVAPAAPSPAATPSAKRGAGSLLAATPPRASAPSATPTLRLRPAPWGEGDDASLESTPSLDGRRRLSSFLSRLPVVRAPSPPPLPIYPPIISVEEASATLAAIVVRAGQAFGSAAEGPGGAEPPEAIARREHAQQLGRKVLTYIQSAASELAGLRVEIAELKGILEDSRRRERALRVRLRAGEEARRSAEDVAETVAIKAREATIDAVSAEKRMVAFGTALARHEEALSRARADLVRSEESLESAARQADALQVAASGLQAAEERAKEARRRQRELESACAHLFALVNGGAGARPGEGTGGAGTGEDRVERWLSLRDGLGGRDALSPSPGALPSRAARRVASKSPTRTTSGKPSKAASRVASEVGSRGKPSRAASRAGSGGNPSRAASGAESGGKPSRRTTASSLGFSSETGGGSGGRAPSRAEGLAPHRQAASRGGSGGGSSEEAGGRGEAPRPPTKAQGPTLGPRTTILATSATLAEEPGESAAVEETSGAEGKDEAEGARGAGGTRGEGECGTDATAAATVDVFDFAAAKLDQGEASSPTIGEPRPADAAPRATAPPTTGLVNAGAVAGNDDLVGVGENPVDAGPERIRDGPVQPGGGCGAFDRGCGKGEPEGAESATPGGASL